jgi:N-acetylglutamate synthase-like GNAT family acetyltransferase
MKMKIEHLSQNMHFFRTVAELKFQEFSYLTGNETLEDYLNRQKKYITEQLIPQSYVVLNEARHLLGTFALKCEDLKSRLDLSPWLGSVVVVPSYRRQGVGSFIVCQARRLAKELGYSQLYLYTPDQEAWYAKQGWQLIEHSFSGQFPISVMSSALNEVQ